MTFLVSFKSWYERCRKLSNVAKPSERTLDMITRLGWEIPLTLWPSLFLIGVQEGYSTEWASCRALHSVDNLALWIEVGLTCFGILLVMFGKRSAETGVMATMAILINICLVYGFVVANSTCQSFK